MTRTTEHTITTPVPTTSDPLLQLEYETQTPNGPESVRGLLHPAELALRGMPVTCSACRARRDWLLLNHRRNVWVRCRCGKEWLEPEITRKDFDALIANPTWTRHATTEAARVALGFDGTFAGIYLD
ncbi:hypothetical protein P3T27_005862 [Kitasatospora sp. MAA19]|uniref:hypothetical protein n=1 Tax=unclassified Kitasatospora TaxID=2633591 RepID=UPI0024740F22|nr:hypothetical protein [Kitasatospora sp. MAA19]MDH6709116.1 hypothetical protein [Kitasatospora sp. MAA19]